jgi:hypothetical protein
VIWEPFLLALVLGIIVSAGLYFAYLWPSVEPIDEPAATLPEAPAVAPTATTPEISSPDVAAATDGAAPTDGTTTTDDPTSPAS